MLVSGRRSRAYLGNLALFTKFANTRCAQRGALADRSPLVITVKSTELSKGTAIVRALVSADMVGAPVGLEGEAVVAERSERRDQGST